MKRTTVKETLKNIVCITSLVLVIVCGVALIGYDIRKANKVWENAQRYAIENNCECYGSKYSIVYTFSNYSIIGEDVLYRMYE